MHHQTPSQRTPGTCEGLQTLHLPLAAASHVAQAPGFQAMARYTSTSWFCPEPPTHGPGPRGLCLLTEHERPSPIRTFLAETQGRQQGSEGPWDPSLAGSSASQGRKDLRWGRGSRWHGTIPPARRGLFAVSAKPDQSRSYRVGAKSHIPGLSATAKQLGAGGMVSPLPEALAAAEV